MINAVTFEEFYSTIVPDNTKIITFETFKRTSGISRLANKIEKEPNDIRYCLFKTKNSLFNKDVFLEWCYDFFIVRHKDILKELFKSRLELKDFSSPFFNLEIIKNNTISNRYFWNREIRNLFFYEIVSTKNLHKMNLILAFKNLLEKGNQIEGSLLGPSIFKDLYENNYPTSSFLSILRKISFNISVYSPIIYASLINEQSYKLKKKNPTLLCPTASWGTPVIAIHNLKNYDSVCIVDVQKSVLETCIKLNDYLNSKPKLIKKRKTIEVFHTPSEKMSNLIQKKFDHIFFCPPYYTMEEYSFNRDLQSTELYKDYNDWLEKYWRKTCSESDFLLDQDGIFSFTINKKYYDDMIKIAKEFFIHEENITIETFVGKTSTSKLVENNNTIEYCVTMRKK